MDDGLNIRWRQTAPDRSLVTLALEELRALHAQWPETVQCDIVVEPFLARARNRALRPTLSSQLYRVSVDIDFGLVARARGEGAEADAVARDMAAAMRLAFGKLWRDPSARRRSVRAKLGGRARLRIATAA